MIIRDNCLIFLFVKYRVHTAMVFLFSHYFIFKIGFAVLLQAEKSLKTATKCAKNIFTMTV
ncbi:hypothetical protein DWW16_12070 [Bacteroides clarus]|uniref:Uncharacterized protein n=1 Tax=Bacteroides clarus TaxID=626929 RepID=A0A412Y7F2_9BACE|nr:hypothetical protein DWW16_12070 [Bacteroides clarus]RGV53254.1 hypothetical protein DWW09_10335 [Bacteroides clarus]